ncbi:L,D-transpeptidase [Streptomyces halobius]|uniref:Ig-like domain-containing protein n=1 Tax=Streptomyces halobius TaxID=2879846 RepID=A0ABY4M1S6_9ACTN|nr:Ig-like domain-containing protein [Streptomyces halobius]UQA91138.1 Ig-like domain-containing protein [Streptomyces halobius]
MRREPAGRPGAGNRGAHRGLIRCAVLAAAVAVTLVACSGPGDPDSGAGALGDARNRGEAKAEPPGIVVEPVAEGGQAPPGGKVTVRAKGGRLTEVKVSAPDTDAFAGTMARDGSAWISTARLAPGTTYTVSTRAQGADGKEVTERSTLSTAQARDTFVGEYSPDKGTTVGVAMPVSITFNKPIRDKAAVERGLTVSAKPAVEGSWSWMKDRNGKDRIDYRPKEFWKSGTQVTLRMSLSGVDAGGGVLGTQQRVVHFTIGKSVVSTVDVKKKTMTVAENGKVLRTLPVSNGKKGFDTWSGTMVVLSKVPTLRMDSRTVGIFGPEAYDIGEVRWDVQLTPSGTYAHAAPWNEGLFGKVNASHGCIGMSMKDAKWFYDRVGLGDPVTVVNSAEDTVATNNGYGDWNVDWKTWQDGSALR